VIAQCAYKINGKDLGYGDTYKYAPMTILEFAHYDSSRGHMVPTLPARKQTLEKSPKKEFYRNAGKITTIIVDNKE
jgi:hypothetical protein